MTNYKFSTFELVKIFGLYFNNPVMVNGVENRVFLLDRGGSINHLAGEEKWLDVDDIKLILTPIHKITNDHVIEIANLTWVGRKIDWTITRRNKNGVWMEGKSPRNDWQKYYFRIDEYCEITCQYFIIDEEERKTFDHNIGRCVDDIRMGIPYILILDRLREMGYAVPYKAIDLFKGGAAIEIEQTELKTS
jgi:hypothetical protein